MQHQKDFKLLIPHLKTLTKGAVHLTGHLNHENSDTYNKLIELYWACLLMEQDLRIDLDHPEHSTGSNPDVIVSNEEISRAYAFKTIESKHTQTILEHVKKGVDQIEKCQVDEGVVALHFTPYVTKYIYPWPPKGKFYASWQDVTRSVRNQIAESINQVIIDNGQEAIDEIFQGKKAKGTIMCVCMFVTLAENPLSRNPVAMPIKLLFIIDIAKKYIISDDYRDQIESANKIMQQAL